MAMDAAWTLKGQAFSASTCRIAAWSFPYTGSAPVLTVTNNSVCYIVAYQPTAGSTLSVDGSAQAQTAISASAASFPTAVPSQANEMVVFGSAMFCGSSVFGAGLVSGTDPTVGALVLDQNDSSFLETALADGIRTASTGTGSRTQSYTDNGPVGGIVVLLKETGGGVSTYYVKVGGSDALDGLSPANAWATVAKVNAAQGTGNTVLFNKGDTWREVLAAASGMTYSSFGAGAKPIINGTRIATGWAGAGPTYTVAVTAAPNQVFVNGVRAPHGASAGTLTAGQWFWAANVLTYRPVVNSNPDTQGLLVESDDPATLYYGVYINAAVGVTVDGLNTKQHAVGGIFGENSTAAIRNNLVEKCYRHGIAYFDAVNNKTWTIEDNVIDNVGGAGIHMGAGAQDFLVRRNTITNFALRPAPADTTWVNDGTGNQDYNAGIKMAGATSLRNIVTLNTIHDGGNQSAVDTGAGIWADVDSNDHVWSYNYIYNVQYEPIRVELSDNVTVHHNTVVGRGTTSVDDIGIDCSRDVHNNKVYHNTVYNCAVGYIVQADGTGTATGNILRNNIALGSQLIALQAMTGGENPAGEGNIYENNVFVDAPNSIKWGNPSYSSIAAWMAIAPVGVKGNIGLDPVLLNPAANDFRLNFGSPAIDTGLVITGINDGSAGSIAYLGGGPDIGALESTVSGPWSAGDRVLETTTSSGTGPIVLGGAVAGYQAFAAVCKDATTVFYAIAGATEWEVGLGRWNADTTLTRLSVLESSNNNMLVNFSTGAKNVSLDYPAMQGQAALTNRVQTTNLIIPNGAAMYVPGPYDIAAGVTLDIGQDAVLEIG